MDKNQGYEIIKAVMLENGRGFALGHHPTAPSPYVTWACYDDKDGQRKYEWGDYGSDRAALEQGAQDIVLGPARHAGQIGGGVIHDLADAGIAIHDLCSFCKHCGALPYCFCLYYSTFFGRM